MINKELETFTNELKKTPLVQKTEIVLNKIWNSKNKKSGIKYKDEFKYLFGLRLFQYAQGKRYDLLHTDEKIRGEIIYAYRGTNQTSSKAKQFQRLSLGYNALTLHLSPSICNLSSIAANKKYKDTTKDHIIGVTSSAQYIKHIFQEGKASDEIIWTDEKYLINRIDYMTNIWLKDNLWLWAQCRITKDEHKPENLLRVSNKNIRDEILYKAQLKHYENADIKLATDYKNITP
jgi:hypothetical protein